MNFNHCKAAHGLLGQLAQEFNVDVPIINEPHGGKDNVVWATDKSENAEFRRQEDTHSKKYLQHLIELKSNCQNRGKIVKSGNCVPTSVSKKKLSTHKWWARNCIAKGEVQSLPERAAVDNPWEQTEFL